jgi:hypothetical protein
MPRLLALIPLALALIAPPALAADKPPISLAKVSKWEINYNEDSCNLFAKFEAGGETAILGMTRVQPTDFLELKIFGKMVRSGGIEMPIEIAFGQPQVPYKRMGVAVTTSTPDKLPAVIVSRLRLDGWDYPAKASAAAFPPKVSPNDESTVTSITFKAGTNKRYRLETGSLAAPMAAMRTCTDDLLRHWGFDPAVQAGITTPTAPTNNPGNWLGTSDFPNKALLLGHNGIVQFRLDVEADGKVSACRVLYRTNPDDFADLSCKLLMKRAQMSPALDAQGAPVKSFYISRIRWQAGDW